MVVTHNLLAMNGNRMLGINGSKKAKSSEKLSSGFRINRSADDAAGLAISEKMRRQIRGLNQGSANCQEGVSFNQVADGAMEEVSGMLHRMEELAVKAANGTMTSEDREYIQQEIEQLKSQIDEISEKTTFNELPVFGTHVRKTTYASSTEGAPVVDQDEYYMEGKTFGLAAVLNADGGEHLSTSKKLSEPLSFSGTGWTTTGTVKYSGSGYGTLGEVANGISTFTNGMVDGAVLQNMIDNGINSTTSYRGASGSDPALKSNVNISYSGAKDMAGKTVADKITVDHYRLKQDGLDMNNSDNWTLVGTRSYSLRTGCPGAQGLNDGQNYPSIWMDFSGLGTVYDKESLYGLGFNTTCCHGCGRYYSVEFTDDSLGAAYKLSGQGQNPVLQLNISDCSSGTDLVQKFMNAVTSAGSNSFTDHYQQYAVNSAEPAKLYVYDNSSRYYPNGGSSSFEPVVRDTTGQRKDENLVVNLTNGQMVTHESEDIWIQSGAEAHTGFYMQRACVNTEFLGISGGGVADTDAAGHLMEAVKGANHILSEQRAMVGAQQNRCERAIHVDDNSSENTTAAESSIRDADMAKEMLDYSRQNILEQVSQSMLTQANQASNGILSMLQ